MGSHLGAIGFGQDPTALPDRLHGVMTHATPIGTADGDVSVYRYVDPSGSTTTVTLEGARVTCMTPGVMPGRIVTGTCGALLEDECPYERPLNVEAQIGDLEIPLAVTIDDLAVSAPSLAPGRTVRLAIGALAEQISVFADEAAYRASGTPMAVESLIPSGLFSPEVLPGPGSHRPSSRILMSGVVTSSESRVHALFGEPFVVATVRSMGDEWQVAIDPADLDGRTLGSGSILSGTFWVSGHIADVTDAAAAPS